MLRTVPVTIYLYIQLAGSIIILFSMLLTSKYNGKQINTFQGISYTVVYLLAIVLILWFLGVVF